MKPLTKERLQELLDYDPETGQFTRKAIRKGKLRDGAPGQVTSWGYLMIGVDGGRYFAHRLAWLWVHGEFPSGQIDHVNMDKLDNRIGNLRIASPAENAANRPPCRNNRSGHKGVSLHAKTGKWGAFIRVGGRNRCLGYFTDMADAVSAYRDAASERFGAFARFQ